MVKRRTVSSVETVLGPGLIWVLVGAGCDTDQGKGEVAVTAYGESFVEDGIPAREMGDRWAIDFTRFDVHITDVSVAGLPIEVPADVVDVCKPSAGEGHELGEATVPAGDHDGARFTIASVDVEGTATKGGEVKSFHWVFDQPTRYSECDTVTTVTDGDRATFQITIHGDHLFYDSLVAESPHLLFQALADADRDGDGFISRGELAAADIGAYDPGSEDGIDDLWAWLSAQVRALGHVDGEGHCRATAVD